MLAIVKSKLDTSARATAAANAAPAILAPAILAPGSRHDQVAPDAMVRRDLT